MQTPWRKKKRQRQLWASYKPSHSNRVSGGDVGDGEGGRYLICEMRRCKGCDGLGRLGGVGCGIPVTFDLNSTLMSQPSLTVKSTRNGTLSARIPLHSNLIAG